MYEDMQDDHFKNKNIAELAWFLATGEDEKLPKLSSPGALLLMYKAHLRDFSIILEVLIKSTLSEVGGISRKAAKSKRTAHNRLKDFTRQNIYKALNQSKPWSSVHQEAQKWLTNIIPHNSGSKKKNKTVRGKRTEMWEGFLKDGGRRKEELTPQELRHLQNEFEEKMFKPAQEEESREENRNLIVSASRQIRYELKDLVGRDRVVSRNFGLYSPEFKEHRCQQFYLDRRERFILPHLGDDADKNNTMVKKKAESLYYLIESNRQSKNPENYGFLLNDAGETPQIEELYRHLTDAQWLLIRDPSRK